MAVSKKQLKHLSLLARIRFDDQTLSLFQKDFKGILNYVDKLKKVDIKIKNKDLIRRGRPNIFRSDRERDRAEANNNKLMVESVPEKKDKLFKVPVVLNKK